MAHISGSGTSASDPYIIDELEDLAPLLQNKSNGINYIAFPEVYDGPKVFDMRSKGWYSNFINISVDNYYCTKHVYFNGWTILGMSIKDGSFFRFARTSSPSNASSHRIIFYDLIIKNMYVIGITTQSFVFHLESSYGNRLDCIRCKISCMLDGQYAPVGVFVNTVDEEEFHIRECSINASFTNTATGSGRRVVIIDDWHQSRFSFVNTIVSLNSKKWYTTIKGNQQDDMFRCARVQFCKFIGNIIVKEVQSAGSGMSLIMGLVYSVYNVIDIAVKLEIGSSTALYNDFSGGVHVFNTQHITSNTSLTINASNCIKCNDAQMIDKDWLNDRFFIVGENSAY